MARAAPLQTSRNRRLRKLYWLFLRIFLSERVEAHQPPCLGSGGGFDRSSERGNQMSNENLLATLEQTLRQTRTARARLQSRLAELESELETVRREIGELNQL